MATTLERSAATKPASRPRPRFARQVETPAFVLPEGKEIGAVLACTRGPNGDLYILHQPNAQGVAPGSEAESRWLPPLVHLSQSGTFINAWGGPDHIPAVNGVSQWPVALEGLECDDEGSIWIFGYKTGDNAVLKFSQNGELLLRIGERGKTGDDHDTRYLDRPTACYHDIATREVFISDGYGNNRVIAFHSDTGEFTRLWGAYDGPPAPVDYPDGLQAVVHKVARGPSGHLYVADRTGCKIREFELIPGGARCTRTVDVGPGTKVRTTGSCWDIGFSNDGDFMYVADGSNFRVWIVAMDSFEVLGSTSIHDEHENEVNQPIHFSLLHRFTVETNGDLLLAMVNAGVKRLKYLGVS